MLSANLRTYDPENPPPYYNGNGREETPCDPLKMAKWVAYDPEPQDEVEKLATCLKQAVALFAAAQMLPKAQCRDLKEHIYDGEMTEEEIARKLGITQQAVNHNRQKAWEKLEKTEIEVWVLVEAGPISRRVSLLDLLRSPIFKEVFWPICEVI
jgi:predicted DNA-binding protein YlxM (UPF0122 family)